jgi:hypothetical protein
MPGHVFISYSSEDQAAALRWCEALEEAGLPCWIAQRDIRAGAEWAAQIIDGIEAARAVLLLLGPAANRSTQVLREVERATHKGVPVVTVWLENVPLAKSLEYFLSSLHWIGLDGGGFREQIVEVIRALDGVSSESTALRPGKKQRGAPALSQQLLQALEGALAQHVGPIAHALVQRAARRSASRAELIESLAAEIDDPAARKEFVAAAPTLGAGRPA